MAGTPLALLGLAIVVGSAALWFRRMYQVRIPRNRTPFIVVWLSGGALGLIALFQGTGWIGGTAAVLAIGFAAFVMFTVSISRQILAEGAIRVGARLPAVLAPDENGESFELSSLAGRPVLLKFFRGHW